VTAPSSALKDRLGGALLLLMGLFAVAVGRTYPMGAASRLGPGAFPVGLGTILAVIGFGLIVTARRSAPAPGSRTAIAPAAGDGPRGTAFAPEWRGWLGIVLSLVAFVELGSRAGLIPATAAVVFIAALADRQNTVKSAALLALAMLAICVVVFWWALGVQFPLLGSEQ
jgi:hypothetical protein